MNESIDKEQAKKTLPHNLLKGIEVDLADLCIGARS